MKPSFEELLLKIQSKNDPELLLKIQSENDPKHMENSLRRSGIRNSIAQRKLRKDRQNELSTPPLNFEEEPLTTYNLKNQEEYELAKPLVDKTVEEFKRKQEQRKKAIEAEMNRQTFRGVDDIRRYLTQNPK
jgi:hypothetical protein